jgi:hypothetical protein
VGCAFLSTVAFLLLVSGFPLQKAEHSLPPKTETFTWRYGSSVLGEIDVPAGFSADTWNYREGIVTTLKYADGSSIVLQKGFMYRIPMFQDAEDVLDSTEQQTARTMRRGHYKGKTNRWGEVDYKSPVKTSQPGFLGAVGPNLGYANVPRKKAKEFADALESFRLPE